MAARGQNMKLILVRHAKVNCPMPRICDAKGFDNARADYDVSPVFPVEKRLDPARYSEKRFRFYVSTLPRTHETLRGRFGDVSFTETPLLTEVTNRSFAPLPVKLPYFIWQSLGRVEWFLNVPRQPEGRSATAARAEELVSMLEKKGEDCVLVSHEFYLYTLTRILRRHGFKTRRQGRFRIRNLEMIHAEKRS